MKKSFFALNNQIDFFGKRLKLGLSFFLPDWIFHRKDCYFRFRLSVLFYGCDSILRYDLADLKNIAQTFTQLAFFFAKKKLIGSRLTPDIERPFVRKYTKTRKSFTTSFSWINRRKWQKEVRHSFPEVVGSFFFLSFSFSLAPTHTRALSFVFSLS